MDSKWLSERNLVERFQWIAVNCYRSLSTQLAMLRAMINPCESCLCSIFFCMCLHMVLSISVVLILPFNPCCLPLAICLIGKHYFSLIALRFLLAKSLSPLAILTTLRLLLTLFNSIIRDGKALSFNSLPICLLCAIFSIIISLKPSNSSWGKRALGALIWLLKLSDTLLVR
jgi:hypothetical protein